MRVHDYSINNVAITDFFSIILIIGMPPLPHSPRRTAAAAQEGAIQGLAENREVAQIDREGAQNVFLAPWASGKSSGLVTARDSARIENSVACLYNSLYNSL